MNLTNLIGTTLIGADSGVHATVVTFAEGNVSSPNKKTLFIKYTKSNGVDKTFLVDESITSSSGVTFNLYDDVTSIGYGTIFTIKAGILYARDHFVQFPEQNIVVDRYSSVPSAKIGFTITEEIVTFVDDNTLLDPSQGSYNYLAPRSRSLQTLIDTFKIWFEHISR